MNETNAPDEYIDVLKYIQPRGSWKRREVPDKQYVVRATNTANLRECKRVRGKSRFSIQLKLVHSDALKFQIRSTLQLFRSFFSAEGPLLHDVLDDTGIFNIYSTSELINILFLGYISSDKSRSIDSDLCN